MRADLTDRVLRSEEAEVSVCWRPVTYYALAPRITADGKKLLDAAIWGGRRRSERTLAFLAGRAARKPAAHRRPRE